jgi:hypothetical protein
MASPSQHPAAIGTPTTATKHAHVSGPLPTIDPLLAGGGSSSSSSSPAAATSQLQELLSPTSSSGSPNDQYSCYRAHRATTSAKPLIRMSPAKDAGASPRPDWPPAAAALSPREQRRSRSSPLPKVTWPPALKNVAPSIRSAHEAALQAAATAAGQQKQQRQVQQQQVQQKQQVHVQQQQQVLPQVLPERQASSRLATGRGGLHDLAVSRDQGVSSLFGCPVEEVAARATESLGLERC